MERKRRKGRKKKRWDDNIKEWKRRIFSSSSRTAKQYKKERDSCEVICGALTTLQGRIKIGDLQCRTKTLSNVHLITSCLRGGVNK